MKKYFWLLMLGLSVSACQSSRADYSEVNADYRKIMSNGEVLASRPKANHPTTIISTVKYRGQLYQCYSDLWPKGPQCRPS